MRVTRRPHLPSSNGSRIRPPVCSRRSARCLERDFRFSCVAGLAIAVLGFGIGATLGESKDDPWPDLAFDAFNGRALVDGTGLLAIDMPYRAEDAAIVPVTVRALCRPAMSGASRHLRSSSTKIRHRSPPPLRSERIPASSSISTRVRVDSYTNVHAVAELERRQALRRADLREGVGRMLGADREKYRRHRRKPRADANAAVRQRHRHAPASRPREAQIMVRHPNNSGLQMDQVTPPLRPAVLRPRHENLAGRRSHSVDGWRDLDFSRTRTSVSPTCQTAQGRCARKQPIPTITCSTAIGR